MATITFKYTNYGEKETTEFRDYTKNLLGRDAGHVIRYGVESDPMFDEKIVCQIDIFDEDYAFDVVNHFMIDREVNGENVPFAVDLTSVAIYVTGSDKIVNYLTSRSISNLYERMEITEAHLNNMTERYSKLKESHEKMGAFMQQIGVDKFPDIVKELIGCMKYEGHDCKAEIDNILKRRVH